jgi:hypothetical protein
MLPDELEDVLSAFVADLNSRAAKGVPFREEVLRLHLSHSLAEHGFPVSEQQPESRLVHSSRKRVDLVATGGRERLTVAFELKFCRHRLDSAPSSLLGARLLNDLARLADVDAFQSVLSLFVLLVDHPTADLLLSVEWGVREVFGLATGSEYSVTPEWLVVDRTRSFYQALEHSYAPYTVTCARSHLIGTQYGLRVFCVRHTPSSWYAHP